MLPCEKTGVRVRDLRRATRMETLMRKNTSPADHIKINVLYP